MLQAYSKKILILGCSTKAGAYVAKQFHHLGYKIIIYDWTDLPNKNSRFVDEYIHVDSPEIDLNLFSNNFINYLTKNSVSAILPLHDAALEIVRHNASKIPNQIKILGLNTDEVYKYAHNKWDLLLLAKQNNIQVPKTVLVSLLQQINQTYPFQFPCIVKPVSSALIKNNRLYTFKVSVVKNQAELEDLVRELVLNVPVMVQEFIEGYGIGFNFIANQGELFNSYIHQRIHEHGGVSSYRKIVDANAYDNKSTVASFIEKINWTGVGMLEFKVENNVPVLMELNGRFFGSIELSVKSGLNFPKQFLELYLDDKLPQKNQSFHINTKVRNLHDEVLLYSQKLIKGKVVDFLKWKVSVIKSIFTKNDFIEDNIFSDPGFVTALYLADIKRIVKKINAKVKFKQLKTQHHFWALKNDKPLHIAFVCKGNICRSPFAEVYAKKINRFHTFYSFGTIAHENRLSPINAINAALQLNTSLAEHTSKYLKQEIIRGIDEFIIMDKINYFDLVKLGVPINKIKFMSQNEIVDPYKKSAEIFVDTYSTIKNILDQKIKQQ